LRRNRCGGARRRRPEAGADLELDGPGGGGPRKRILMPVRRGLPRYLRLWGAIARYCLLREMSFRVNFLARCITNVVWLLLLLMFVELIYGNTERIGDWDRWQYLFFLGTGMILNGIMEMLFVENCSNLAELIRTGDLDFALTKPIDEQFLLSCQRVDWSEGFNLAVGGVLLAVAIVKTGATITIGTAAAYATLMIAGIAVMYSLLIALAASSVWLVRNQALYELWWYVTQFARYPAEIYATDTALGLGVKVALTFVLPILLAVNLPARAGLDKTLEPGHAAFLLAAAALLLFASRKFFRRALQAYRSASS